MLKNTILITVALLTLNGFAQSTTKEDSTLIKLIYDTSLLNGKSYAWLDHLSNQIGSRLSGSLNAQHAVEWGEKELKQLGIDKVWLQPVMVPKWTRGVTEFAYIETTPGKTTTVPICALGGSVPTPIGGIKAPIIEVKGIEDIEKLGEEKIKGKIVFFNRPMQANLIDAFEAYGGCVDQRYKGAAEASKYGAVGVIVRSMNFRQDDYPHTGAMSYGDLKDADKIPAAAISTNGANLLSSMLKLNSNIKFHINMNCKTWKDVQSYNVIGEMTGSEFPKEYMVVGGHLDSWDLGDGSHDDGAGIVQSMEVLRLFKEIGYKPKRSIRVVLFMNEENGLRGGKKYAKEAKNKGENHVFALESDAGGFTPRGFSFDCDDANFAQVEGWTQVFKPYLIHYFKRGGSGADIGPLKKDGIVLAGLRPDLQRYFDHHHAKNDTFDAVNRRELELGAATMTSLIYLFDKYGVK
ncbi:M20/M25/M40 family metallo-hydrolase [Aquimarina sp. 2201CG1-2-11]|uniref:M20/M25/M40 family metallo-hydrolase n=1 Tax=Aquimarina discodermiae TaxID=3231043 RepID=UPI00346347EB